MTVSDLLEHLLGLPADYEVLIRLDAGSGVHDLEVSTVDTDPPALEAGIQGTFVLKVVHNGL